MKIYMRIFRWIRCWFELFDSLVTILTFTLITPSIGLKFFIFETKYFLNQRAKKEDEDA